ncbi:MAG: arylamine N-acetyltransferase [Thiofilum sp.]|uniref:arylamine N-acetyltransferase family protein n=1 Tax=Thiofilum sp. TaxID=2212733 RepID=UPI0025FD9CDE|nr:arylamine N-acetyltransferase [Thiofilum sp.]MBK8455391.1 arylamine N-acetyltransferase [Thiofilum sp.]
MLATNFSLQDYLVRIQYQGAINASAAHLKTLMQQQLFHIPFENLDVLAGKVISLVPEDIVHKLIHNKHGGYCYEVNGLFTMVLQALDIPYQLVAARPMFYPVKRPKTHMAVIATVEGQEYLCDLGFGSYCIREPLNLADCNQPIQQGSDTFQLIKQGDEYILQALVEGNWINQYGFNRCPVEFIDFAPANWMNSTHKDAIFTQKYLIVKFNPQGRTILLGDQLKQVIGKTTQVQTIQPADIKTVLREHFNLNLPS